MFEKTPEYPPLPPDDVYGFLEKAREPPLGLERAASRVRGERRQLGHDEDGVLLAVDDLLAELVCDESAIGRRVVPVKVHERGDTLVRAEAVV